MTPFSSQCEILARVYQIYRHQPGFEDFAKLYDVGLPLAFLVDEGIVIDLTSDAEDYITQTWDAFLDWLKVPDTGISNLEEIFDTSPFVTREK